jgi:hypothetical protein
VRNPDALRPALTQHCLQSRARTPPEPAGKTGPTRSPRKADPKMYKIADRVLLTLFLLTLFQPFFRRLVYYAEPIKQSRLSNALMPQRAEQ